MSIDLTNLSSPAMPPQHPLMDTLREAIHRYSCEMMIASQMGDGLGKLKDARVRLQQVLVEVAALLPPAPTP